MGLDFAIDELYASGWSALDSSGCAHHTDGRAFPTIAKITQAFEAQGLTLSIRHIQLFDCYRAHWREAADSSDKSLHNTTALGAVVGQSEQEAAVYALSQMRRQCVTASMQPISEYANAGLSNLNPSSASSNVLISIRSAVDRASAHA